MEVGLGAEAVSRTTPESKERFGVLAYALSTLETLRSSEAIEYRIVVDGQEYACRGRICSITNAGKVGLGEISYAPGISVDDGYLDVVVLGEDILKELSAWLAKFGSLRSEDRLTPAYLNHWQAREIMVAADPPQLVLVDGEAWGETPVTIGVRPQALAVLVPPLDV
jgi:diacylglycerol kinase family enzyme